MIIEGSKIRLRKRIFRSHRWNHARRGSFRQQWLQTSWSFYRWDRLFHILCVLWAHLPYFCGWVLGIKRKTFHLSMQMILWPKSSGYSRIQVQNNWRCVVPCGPPWEACTADCRQNLASESYRSISETAVGLTEILKATFLTENDSSPFNNSWVFSRFSTVRFVLEHFWCVFSIDPNFSNC